MQSAQERTFAELSAELFASPLLCTKIVEHLRPDRETSRRVNARALCDVRELLSVSSQLQDAVVACLVGHVCAAPPSGNRYDRVSAAVCRWTRSWAINRSFAQRHAKLIPYLFATVFRPVQPSASSHELPSAHPVPAPHCQQGVLGRTEGPTRAFDANQPTQGDVQLEHNSQTNVPLEHLAVSLDALEDVATTAADDELDILAEALLAARPRALVIHRGYSTFPSVTAVRPMITSRLRRLIVRAESQQLTDSLLSLLRRNQLDLLSVDREPSVPALVRQQRLKTLKLDTAITEPLSLAELQSLEYLGLSMFLLFKAQGSQLGVLRSRAEEPRVAQEAPRSSNAGPISAPEAAPPNPPARGSPPSGTVDVVAPVLRTLETAPSLRRLDLTLELLQAPRSRKRLTEAVRALWRALESLPALRRVQLRISAESSAQSDSSEDSAVSTSARFAKLFEAARPPSMRSLTLKCHA